MSFAIFFYSYERGEPCPFPLSHVEAAFGAAIVRRERTAQGIFWWLEYPVLNPPVVPVVMEINGRECPVVVRDGAEVYVTVSTGADSCLTTDGFMVKGPAAHLDFHAALLRLLQSTHSAVFWPGDNALVVGQLDSIGHLPEGMAESLGAPFLVSEPQQIIDRISGS
jgi:hypothetical protein